MTRRNWMAAAASALSAAAYPTVLEPRWLEVVRIPVHLPVRPSQPILLLQLTDLHASWAVPWSLLDNAVSLGLAAHPDLICLTGDFITHKADWDPARYRAILRRLSAAAPTFAVLGNHDGGSWAAARRGYADHTLIDRLLDDAGIHLLHNRAMPCRIRDDRFLLIGVGDLWSGELDSWRAFRSLPPNLPRLLLSHNPDSKSVLEVHPWDLMLCGHTHGGQVMIPFEGPRYAPIDDKRYVAGLNDYNGRPIYTSRGVGSLGSVRFRCRPEVTLLTLEPG
jgi:uncharacterized protein